MSNLDTMHITLICLQFLIRTPVDMPLYCSYSGLYFMVSPLVHIWCYDSFEAMAEAKMKLSNDKEWADMKKARSKLLLSRSNQVLMAFTYWKPQFDHMSDKIFELRSYTLRVSITCVVYQLVYKLFVCLSMYFSCLIKDFWYHWQPLNKIAKF